MTFLKLLGKISTISILLLVPFLLGANKRQPSSGSTIVIEQKVNAKNSIFNSNINSNLRLIERPWLIAQRQSKVALVIGNGNYEELPLRNPVNDATDVAAALKNLGFEIIDEGALLNLNKQQMNNVIDKFRERLRQGGVGVFYYAGHGVAIDGVNYLIPINADLDVMADVDGEAIRLSKVLNSMESANTQFNFIIVDACRNNPVYRQWPSALRSGFIPKGLAEEKPPRGTIILYSARYGTTAIDGTGRNSPFASHLLQHIETPNLDIAFMIRRVTDGVIEATKDRKDRKEPQEPWREGSVRGSREFYLNPIEEQQPLSTPTVEGPTPLPQNNDAQPELETPSSTTAIGPQQTFPTPSPPSRISELCNDIARESLVELDGESLQTALKVEQVGGLKLANGWIGNARPVIYYRFCLANDSKLRLTWSEGIRLNILNEKGNVVDWVAARQLHETSLSAGNYYLKVHRFPSRFEGDYQLQISAEPLPNP